MVDVVNIPPPATGDQSKGPNDDALAAKVDAKNGTPERPEWLPEKFQSPADLAKAYAELEAKLGKAPTEKAEEPPKETPKETQPVTEDAAKSAVEAAGLDFNELGNQIATDGTISGEARKALEAKGIPGEVIDSYVDGIKAQTQLQLREAYDHVGGEQSFRAIADWAAEGASEAQVETYNALLESGKYTAALDYLKSAYTAANGKAPSVTVTGRGNAPAPDGDSYESRQQVTADMKNPLYTSDPAFRARVQAKLARSNVF